jgi:hypothetical protein
MEMMKKLVFACCLIAFGTKGFAQYHRHDRDQDRPNTYSDAEQVNGFKKENLFIGGGVGLGFSSYDFNAGLSPELGYSLTKWLDAGALVNFNYSSIRADPYFDNNVRQRSFNYGVGLFARAYPLPFLFFQAEPEYNWTSYNQKYVVSGATFNGQFQAASFLAGVGYGQRIVGRSNFYIAIMLDLLSNYGSPYRDLNGTAVPVIKAGFDIYLHPRRQ